MAYFVIGAGGIGYHLVEPLVRFLNYNATESEVIIVDGDTVEEGNLGRQHIASSVGRNKAEVLASTINSRILPKKSVRHIPLFLTPTSVNGPEFDSVITTDSVFFVCVDNNATRVFVETICCNLRSSVMISGGNDEFKGQAQLFIRMNGKNLTPLPSEVNPEILEIDQFPDEVGCDQIVASEPQIIFTNNMVASSMLNLWFSQVWLKVNKPEALINEVCTDITKSSAFPFNRKSLVKS